MLDLFGRGSHGHAPRSSYSRRDGRRRPRRGCASIVRHVSLDQARTLAGIMRGRVRIVTLMVDPTDAEVSEGLERNPGSRRLADRGWQPDRLVPLQCHHIRTLPFDIRRITGIDFELQR